MLWMRHLVHAIVGGSILFAWAVLAHLGLGLDTIGLKPLPAEARVVAGVQQEVVEPGLYLFPGAALQPGLSLKEREEAMARSIEKARSGPNGLLLWHPRGHDYLSNAQFAREYVGDLLCALLASVFLTLTTFRVTGFWARTGFVTMLGAFASLAVDLPLWNRYGFPSEYLLAALFKNLVGFTLVGLFLAWRMKPVLRIPARPSTKNRNGS
jgi:hypothetical protein